jgi:hypothetical protein
MPFNNTDFILMGAAVFVILGLWAYMLRGFFKRMFKRINHGEDPPEIFFYAKTGKHGMETHLSENASRLQNPYKEQLITFMQSCINELSKKADASAILKEVLDYNEALETKREKEKVDYQRKRGVLEKNEKKQN